ncbi:aatC, ATP binding protein of ABC transporter [Escherichia coli DEC6E]|nr:aatC, ATP binding protein of ABC transporter [Escherichia coli DEC6E]
MSAILFVLLIILCRMIEEIWLIIFYLLLDYLQGTENLLFYLGVKNKDSP